MSDGEQAHDAADRFRLARTEGVGPITYRRLMRRYGSAAAALDALPALARAGGRDRPPPSPEPSAALREIERLGRMGAHLRFVDTDAYPKLLALLEDAPPVIAVQGDARLLNAPAVAVVGGRNASANGQRMAESLGADLAAAGLIVVSGLARGVDAAAHRGALPAGRTVAVVAGGLDCPYPPEHTDLQRQIAEGGAVVAEAPLGTVPQSRHFPRRNRIIAGLVLGVVVVEAAPRSGSLITARLAARPARAGRQRSAAPGSPPDRERRRRAGQPARSSGARGDRPRPAIRARAPADRPLGARFISAATRHRARRCPPGRLAARASP